MKYLFVFIFSLLAFTGHSRLYAQTNMDDERAKIQQKIDEINRLLADNKKSQDTLANRVKYYDFQIQLANLKVEQAVNSKNKLEQDLLLLSTTQKELESNLNYSANALLEQINALYKLSKVSPLAMLLTSSNFNETYLHYKYLNTIQTIGKKSIVDMESRKQENEKIIAEKSQKQAEYENALKEITNQKNNSAIQKKAQENLLQSTKNDEKTYKQQKQELEKQLESFKNFITAQGGAGLLTNQTKCDDWGCYYNQRDSEWGRLSLGDTKLYMMNEYGCLVTSTAMLASHMGKRIKPYDIAINDSNFSLGTGYLKMGGISAAGGTINRNRIGSSISDVDRELAQNHAVIVGVKISSYAGTHFVVIKNKKDGKYIMNDPFIPNGSDLNFESKYSVKSIFAVDTVSLN